MQHFPKEESHYKTHPCLVTATQFQLIHAADVGQGAKTIKKNTNSTQNKSETHRAKQYEVTSFLSTDCELSTETCSKNVYSLSPRRSSRPDRCATVVLWAHGSAEEILHQHHWPPILLNNNTRACRLVALSAAVVTLFCCCCSMAKICSMQSTGKDVARSR